MRTKRSLSLLLSFLLAISLLPGLALPVRAEDSPGTCGEHVRWTLDSAGTLTIFPEEEGLDPDDCYMDDCSDTERAPWYDSRASVRKVIVEEGVAYLGSYAFDGCSSLENVLLPGSLLGIGTYVFRGCDALAMIEVSDGNDSFYSDDGVLLGDNCLYRYPPAKEDKYYCIPEDTYGSITTGAFEGAKHLVRLYIPEVSDISFPVFEGCENLTKLYIGGDAEYMSGWEPELISDLPCESVLFQYDATAEDCVRGLDGNPCGENVTWKVKDGVLTISGTGPMENYAEYDEEDDSWTLWDPPWWHFRPGADADENRDQITDLVVEEGVTTVGAGAFRDLGKLETVSLPTTLTTLGGWAFDSDTSLKKVEIPNGVTTISDSAFSDSGLTEVVLPESVTDIETWAFGGTSLEKIDLPAGLRSIGPWAFYGTPLKRADIPASVTSIGERAFYECLSLAEFAVDEANTAYRSVAGSLFSKDGTEMISYGAGHTASSYTVPDGVRKLHPSAFSYSESLAEVRLPDTLEEIGNWCFGHTGLKKVTVPAHVSAIQFNAFGACGDLESATLPARLTTLEDGVFSGDEALKDVFFEGTQEQWAVLTDGHKDETLKNVTIHYRYDAYCPHEKLVHHPAVPHGCLVDGTVEYWKCEACGALFSDAAAENWIDNVTDPAAHSYRSTVTLAANCSQAGVRTWTCTVCDEGTEGHSYTEPIPATGRHHFVDGHCDNVLQDGVTVCGVPEELAGGTLENGMTWSIDGMGTLHIRGTGDLPRNYFNWSASGFTTDAPWYPYRGSITALRIHSGITSTDVASFAGLTSMKKLYVPASVTKLNFFGFFECRGLEDVYYEGTSGEWLSIDRGATNLISIAHPVTGRMMQIVDHVGNADKHFEYDPDLTYTVTWVDADGTVLQTDTGVLPGDVPDYTGEEPVKAGDAQYTYVFDGWLPAVGPVTGDVTYTAAYRNTLNRYTVVFDAGGHAAAPAPQTADYGTQAADPGPLTAEGWIFGGWQLDGQAYDFNTAVTGPLTLTAKWTEVKVETISVSAGSAAAQGTLPDTDEDFTVEATVTLPEDQANDGNVPVLVVSYDGEGRFLKMESAELTRTELNTYSAKAGIINDGEVARLKIFILDKETWVPLAGSRELKR